MVSQLFRVAKGEGIIKAGKHYNAQKEKEVLVGEKKQKCGGDERGNYISQWPGVPKKTDDVRVAIVNLFEKITFRRYLNETCPDSCGE